MKKIMLILAILAGLTLVSVMALGDSTIMGGKCSMDSQCKYGQCKNGKCGYCFMDSHCKGYGQCKNNQCGYCHMASHCKGFGTCSNNQCTKPPW